MTKYKEIVILLFVAVMVISNGCSNSNSPVLDDSSMDSGTISSLPVGVTDRDEDGSPVTGMGALGVFNLHVDPDDISAELTPLRESALTDVLEVVDITNFLTMAPCFDCAIIKSVSLDADSHPVVTIGIKHPFGVGDPFKPISGQNRGDLHVFNVEGILVSNAPGTSFSLIGQTAAGFPLISADGYTGYLDEVLEDIYPTDATVHPYVLHFDDYSQGNFDAANSMGFASVTDPPPSGNLVMAMGCDYDYQDYVFNVDEPIDFIYTIGCTYAVSAGSKIERFTPEYRIPQHNKKAACEVSVTIIQNELRGGITDSYADIEIEVVDVSHNVPVGSGLDEMLMDSSVDDIFIDAPGIMSSMIVLDGSNPQSGTGHDPSDPLVYPATITNNLGGEEGIHYALVKVSDSYAPGQNVLPLLEGKDGIERVNPLMNPLSGLFNIAEFATYQVIELDVGPGCGPITGSITSPACPLAGVADGQSIGFEASASSANGGDPVVLYEWDMDYDGVTFDVDATGDSVSLGPFENPNCGTPPEDPVTYTVAVRGTDSCDTPNVTVFDTCEVTVDTCEDIYKNIPLRDGVEAWDLVVDPLDGRVLIVYSDGLVYERLLADLYQVGSLHYDSDWFNTQIPPGFYGTYDCVPDKAFLGISDNHYFILGYGMYISDWTDRAWYDIVDDSGSLVSHIVPHGNWPWSYSIFEVVAWDEGGSLSRHFGNIWSCSSPYNWAYLSHSSPSNNYQTEYYAYNQWGTPGNLAPSRYGVDVVWPGWVRGMEVDTDNLRFWVVETNDYYASQWRIQASGGSINYENKYFGTGSQTDSDDGFNKPRDLTRTDDNTQLVLDELSDESYRVKAYDVTSSPGTFTAGLDVVDLIGPINRIDTGDWNDPTDGNMMFVLHGDETEGFYLSIYRESELPW